MMEQNENKQEQLEETAAAEETTNEEVSAQETEDGTTEERPNGWKKELLSWCGRFFAPLCWRSLSVHSCLSLSAWTDIA